MQAGSEIEEPLRWRVPCVDDQQEEREVTVLVMGDRVTVVLPPNDVVVLDAEEARDFADLLWKAATFAALRQPSHT